MSNGRPRLEPILAGPQPTGAEDEERLIAIQGFRYAGGGGITGGTGCRKYEIQGL